MSVAEAYQPTRINPGLLVKRLVLVLGAVFIAAWVILPLYWIVLTSISYRAELLNVPPHWIPQRPTLTFYQQILTNLVSGRIASSQSDMVIPGIRNSLLVSLTVTALNVLIGSVAAYAFARLRFFGRRSLLVLLLAATMVPAFVLIVPYFVVFRTLGLTNTREGVILAHLSISLAFTIWILRGYLTTISIDLERAARVDGCSRLQAMWHVVLPLAAPGLVTAALFAFLGSWNEFLFALVLNSRVDQMMVQPAIAGMYSMTMQEYGLMGAGSVLGALPTILLTLVFQRYLVQGLLSGGVKG